MRKSPASLLRAMTILLLSFIFSKGANAQTYELTISNETLVSAAVYQFDVYIKRTGTTDLELANIGFGIGFDITTLNGGTPSFSIVSPGSTYCDLLPAQQPATTTIGAAIQTQVVGGVTYRYMNVVPRVNPGPGNGTHISNAGSCPSNGMRIGRFQLTNSVAFAVNSTFKHIFSTTAGSGRANTIVSAYIGTVATQITNQAWHFGYSTAGTCLQNILLNFSGCTFSGFGTTTAVTCNGLNNGTATITLTGVNAVSQGTCTIDGGAAQPFTSNPFTITGLNAGNHTILALSPGGCSSTGIPVSIGAGAIVTGSFTKTNTVACNGADLNSGSITVTPSGGTAPYSYNWTGPNGFTAGNTSSITGLAGGSYNVIITDANSCAGSISNMLVGSASLMNVTATGIISSCINTGSVTLNAAGGAAPFNYSLDGINYQLSNTLNGLTPGSYTGYAKDANGCIATTAFIISQTNIHISRSTGAISNFCVNTGRESVVADGGRFPYSFSLDDVNYITVLPGGEPTVYTFTNLAPGAYTVYVKDAAGCKNTNTFFVSRAGQPGFRTSITASGSCVSSGSVRLERRWEGETYPPYTYSLDGINYSSSNIFNNLSGGTYTGYIKDGYGCIGSSQVIIPQDAPVSVTARFTNAGTCVNSGTIQANDATGGRPPFTYSIDGITFQASKSFTGLAPGTYTLTAKDYYGCLGNVSVTISQNPINVTYYATNATGCAAGNGKIQLFLTGGYSPYSYSIDGVNYQVSNLFANLAAGTYSGYVKDGQGCVGTRNGIIVGPTGCNPPPPFAANSNANRKVQGLFKNAAFEVQVYPNPSQSEFTLLLQGYDSQVNVIVTVTDIMGRKVYQADGTGKQQYRFGANFITGIYNVQVIQGADKKSIKLIKE